MSERKIPGADRATPGDGTIIDRGTDDDDNTAKVAEDKARREHASAMFKWQDELAVDRGLSNFSVRLGSLIRNRVDRRTGYATASQIWYARALGIHKRPVTKNQDDGTRRIRRGVAELVARGRVQKGPGRRLTPIIKGDATWPVWKGEQDSGVPAPPEQTRTQESGFVDSTSDPAGGQTGHGSPRNRTQESAHPDTGVRRNHCSESSSAQQTTLSAERAKDSKQKEEQEKHMQRAAEILGVPLTGERRVRWARDLENQAKDGLEFEIDIEPQMLAEVQRRLMQKPPHVLEVTTLRYFNDAAINRLKEIEDHPEFRRHGALYAPKQWEAIQQIRSRLAADEHQEEIRRSCLALKVEPGLSPGPKINIAKRISEFKARGLTFAQIEKIFFRAGTRTCYPNTYRKVDWRYVRELVDAEVSKAQPPPRSSLATSAHGASHE